MVILGSCDSPCGADSSQKSWSFPEKLYKLLDTEKKTPNLKLDTLENCYQASFWVSFREKCRGGILLKVAGISVAGWCFEVCACAYSKHIFEVIPCFR